jgi:acylglycerol lipase
MRVSPPAHTMREFSPGAAAMGASASCPLREVLMSSPVASSPREETIQSSGAQIFVRSWTPSEAPKAIVTICHGVNSHSGYYLWAGEQLASRGFAVFALDLRGRGRSSGERFYIEHFQEYLDDVDATMRLARSRHPGLPVFLLGHSAGGVVSSVYTLEHQQELAGLICESFAFRVPAPDFVLAVVKGISHLWPHTHVLTLKNEDFSRDPDVVAAMNSDPLIAKESQPSLTVAQLVLADERLEREFPRITLPVLIMHGTADKATRPEGSQQFYDHAGSADKTLKLYDGHVHDLLNDYGREQVMGDILAWIGARLPRRS